MPFTAQVKKQMALDAFIAPHARAGKRIHRPRCFDFHPLRAAQMGNEVKGLEALIPPTAFNRPTAQARI
jgi:hypothetical protein